MYKKPRLDSKTETEHPKSSVEWFHEGATNGIVQKVPAPYLSPDLIEIHETQPVNMRDEEGKLVVRSVHEKDHKSEIDNPIIASWQSGKTGITINVYQFGWHLFGLDFTIVLYGKRRTGKSHFIRWICFQFRPYFPFVIVFTKTKQNGMFQTMFPDSLILEEFDDNFINKLLDTQKQRKKDAMSKTPVPNYRMMIIFDDVLSSQSMQLRYSNCMNRMFFEGRHYGITVLVTIQDSKGIPPSLKQNTDFSILFPMQARRDRETIGDNCTPFAVNDQDMRDFLEIFSYKHQFLAIRNCRGSKPIAEEVFSGILSDEYDLPTFVMGSYMAWRDDLGQLKQLPYEGLESLYSSSKLSDWNIVEFMPEKPPAPPRVNGMFIKPIVVEPEEDDPVYPCDRSGSGSDSESGSDSDSDFDGDAKSLFKRKRKHKGHQPSRKRRKLTH